MNKAEHKFLLYAVLSIFVSLTVLLGVVNLVNFTMAATDADQITEALSLQNGSFGIIDQTPFTNGQNQIPSNPGNNQLPQQPGQQPNQQQGGNAFRQEMPGRFGPMGPDSPETTSSLRYFTYSFAEDGTDPIQIAYSISAISESDAEAWARSLIKESTGWTHGTYRYRVYQQDGRIYVTVIDQGREMVSCYRILIISGIGIVLGTLIGYLVLRLVAKRLFAPIEEADRKQKKFLSQAEKEFKIPLTVISASTELIEREHGSSDQTQSIHRQVKQMGELVKDLGRLSLTSQSGLSEISLSEMLQSELTRKAERFTAKGLTVEMHITPDIKIKASPESIQRLLDEVTDNTVKYALTHASFTLTKEGDRILLTADNDTHLPAGSIDQIFDRFTTLENAGDAEVGLGLSYVKDTIQQLGGRIRARVTEDGVFSLQIAL